MKTPGREKFDDLVRRGMDIKALGPQPQQTHYYSYADDGTPQKGRHAANTRPLTAEASQQALAVSSPIPANGSQGAPRDTMPEETVPAEQAATAAAEKPNSGVPAAVAMRMYYQEVTDRLYVERLFLVREEHHTRRLIDQEHSHILVELASLRNFEHREIYVAARHRAELTSVQRRLEERAGISQLRDELTAARERASTEHRLATELREQVEHREQDRRQLLEQEREAWETQKAALLHKIKFLEAKLNPSGAGGVLASSVPPARGASNTDMPSVNAHSSPPPVAASIVEANKTPQFDHAKWRSEREQWLKQIAHADDVAGLDAQPAAASSPSRLGVAQSVQHGAEDNALAQRLAADALGAPANQHNALPQEYVSGVSAVSVPQPIVQQNDNNERNVGNHATPSPSPPPPPPPPPLPAHHSDPSQQSGAETTLHQPQHQFSGFSATPSSPPRGFVSRRGDASLANVIARTNAAVSRAQAILGATQ